MSDTLEATTGGCVVSAPTFTERYEGVEDRTDWPSGPWDAEPDKVVWVDEATRLDCMARRGGGGAWCGYVGVKEGHPWHGIGYGDHLPIACDKSEADGGWGCYEHRPEALADVHGGLTFAAACADGGDPTKDICHLSDDGPVWWFGFDCSHSHDLRPGSIAFNRRHGVAPLRGEVYRTLDYVIAETTNLASQIKAVAA